MMPFGLSQLSDSVHEAQSIGEIQEAILLFDVVGSLEHPIVTQLLSVLFRLLGIERGDTSLAGNATLLHEVGGL
jgi:hypothetical protein